jgi:hypothetical protein
MIGRTQLSYQLYIRYIPDEDDRENALGKITLCSIEAYAEIILIGNIALEIPENIGSTFTVYPNPTTGELRITNYELRIEQIDIFDIYGRKQLSLTSHSSPLTPNSSSPHHLINLSHLPSGIYLLAIKTASSIHYEKIIKY